MELEDLFNRAITLKNQGQLVEAAKCYEDLLKNYPDCIDACYNLASIYSDLGEVENAIHYYNRVLEYNPEDVETKYFISLCYMKNRQYGLGLPFFENRLCRKSAYISQVHTYPNLMKKAKVWQGQTVKDSNMYTYYEAGFGDVLMFARYLPLLQEKCKKIIFKPQKALYELFCENYPNIRTMQYFDSEKTLDFDYHIPMLSLPYALGLDEKNMFVGKSGYLKANPEKTARYKTDDKAFKVGIKWQGNTTYDFERVIDVEQFKPLISIPNTKFYSFQTEGGAEKTEELGITDIGKTLNNFSDTAGAIENMDLIICNDTSLAHLAGAMGKPCLVLLPYLYNWRWHQDLSRCDWYDSVKLYRQNHPRDWTSVFEKIYDDLCVLKN